MSTIRASSFASDSPTSATPPGTSTSQESRRVRPAGDDAVDAEIAVDAAAFCRGVSARVDPRALTYAVVGDERLAGDVVDALPALAVL